MRGGDETDRDTSFREFVAARRGALVQFGYRLVGGNQSAAEDLVQDSLLKLYERWARVEEPEAWVRTVMTRRYIDNFRRYRKEVLTDWSMEQPVPDRELEGVEDRILISNLVRGLPKKQRAAIVLKYYENLQDRQIAEMLKCKESAVRSNMSRAISKLKSEYWRLTRESRREEGVK